MNNLLRNLSARRFNQLYTVGARFRYYPVPGIPDAVEVVTESEAWELCGRSVVKVSGRIGGVSVSHLELVEGHPVNARDRVRQEHAEWSRLTFGNVGPVGPLKHLSKEALEAASAPGDLLEWADMQFLLWDAQRAAGITDEQITQAMLEKLAINKTRQWPEPKDGEPRLHIVDGVKHDTER